ncbi:MAG: hypothetical protein R6U91_04555 [Bacillota bacterium]
MKLKGNGNDTSKPPEDETGLTENNNLSKEEYQQVQFSWQNILAFCLAMYRLLIPQLILTFIVIIVLIFFLFWIWF